MKVFVLSMKDLTSNVIFKELNEITGLTLEGVAYYNSYTPVRSGRNSNNRFSQLINLLKKMSIKYWLFLVFINIFFRIYDFLCVSFFKKIKVTDSLYSLNYDCKKAGIPIRYEENFNSIEFKQYLKSLNVDLLIIRVSQILDKELLQIPRIGCWCVHSSLLPSYRGIAGEFHALNNNEPFIGSTIFEVDVELDNGEVIAQEKFKTLKKSLFYHIIYNNRLANGLLKKTLVKHISHKPKKFFIDKSIKRCYHTWPQSAQVRCFKKNGGRIITFSQFIKYMGKCLMLL